ncbi:MAG: MBL fold metallo-hydrolase [Chloroflexota bacterium]
MTHPFSLLDVPVDSVAIHWFEQSSYAIKDDQGTLVQIDPYFPTDRPSDRFIYDSAPLDETTLPTNFVLLTHDHLDHTFPNSLARIQQMGWNTHYVGPEESINRLITENIVSNAETTIIQAGQTVSLGSMKAQAVFAKPENGDPLANIDPPDVTHLGYIVEASGHTLYFSGDPINTFAEHADLIGAISAHHPDIGFLTNHPTEGEFPFFEGSLRMAQRIGVKYAVPAHYACFVKRNYDPNEWAAQFSDGDPQPVIVPRNSHIIYPFE